MDRIHDVAQVFAGDLQEELEKAVEDGNSVKLFLAVAFAFMVDATMFFVGLVPFLGLFAAPMVAGFFALVLTIMFWNIGSFIKWKVRGVLYAASFFEAIPFVNLVPFYTLCTLYAIHVIKKHAREAAEALEDSGRF